MLPEVGVHRTNTGQIVIVEVVFRLTSAKVPASVNSREGVGVNVVEEEGTNENQW